MGYYDLISRGYAELYSREQASKIKIIKDNIKISKSTKILDVGCGTGISSDFDCVVVGVDPSMGLLKQNRNSRKILCVAEFLPLKESLFDVVISVTSAHNFCSIRQSINEIKRVGREKFIFSVLKRSKKFKLIRAFLEKNFKVSKVIEEDKDAIFFCENHKLYI